MTYMHIMCFPSLLLDLKKSRYFASLQRTCEANFIGSIIGLQAQKHMKIEDRI